MQILRVSQPAEVHRGHESPFYITTAELITLGSGDLSNEERHESHMTISGLESARTHRARAGALPFALPIQP
jgi:hypothetical protein